MKRIKIALLLLSCVLFLASCNYTRIGGHSVKWNSINGKFDYFNGTKIKSVKVKKDETIRVVIELNVEKGEMQVIVQEDDDNELFKTQTSDIFEFSPDHDTKVEAILHAEKAGGSYKISFEKQGNTKN